MTSKAREKVTTSSYMEEEYPNGVTVYTVYIGVCDPVFLAAYRDKIWGAEGSPLGAIYDASKKWDSQHFPRLNNNPFRQILESISSSSSSPPSSPTPNYPKDRDDDSRHLDPHEKELYGD